MRYESERIKCSSTYCEGVVADNATSNQHARSSSDIVEAFDGRRKKREKTAWRLFFQVLYLPREFLTFSNIFVQEYAQYSESIGTRGDNCAPELVLDV